jgi:uncharacterized protein
MSLSANSKAADGALIAQGLVRHTRLRPRWHHFQYETFFLFLPLKQLRSAPCAALSRNRWGWLSFYDRDHGAGGEDCLAWVQEWLAQQGVHDATGEIWLQCYPRIVGYAFKPVSFWHCHRADGSLAAVVAEVNNTFGERHFYLIQRPDLRFGQDWWADKALHVSPFFQVEGRYKFRFLRSEDRLVARVEYENAEGPVLLTSVSGQLQTLNQSTRRQALLKMPLLTLGVIAKIHWQAVRLLLKRVPFFGYVVSKSAQTSRARTKS